MADESLGWLERASEDRVEPLAICGLCQGRRAGRIRREDACGRAADDPGREAGVNDMAGG